MRVLFVTSEAYPLAKTGGLADVSSALPIALARQGIDIRILLPGYPGALAGLNNRRVECRLTPLLGVQDAAVISGQLPHSEVPVWLVDAPSLFGRHGGLYQDADGRDWADNARRFAFFSHVATKIANGLLAHWRPDVVHVNDWHGGLIPLLLSMQSPPRPATVLTIHNLAFQGNFPREALSVAGIPDAFFSTDGAEFYGQVSFLKAAIRYSDRVTTVSPNYAREVLTPEFGCGLDGVLRGRRESFSGIRNGIDIDFWNPTTDPHLPWHFGTSDMSGKQACKAALQRELGLQISPRSPLIGFASRIAHQKMADVIVEAIPHLVEAGAQFALVGEGDPVLETAFEALGHRYRRRVAIHIGYEEGLAHRLQGGADILLAPARFEPCGLTQLYALRYGTVPIVRKTGGLADTVTNATAATLSDRTATGVIFDDANLADLRGAVDRALALYKEPQKWRRLQRQAMLQNFSWTTSAIKYAALYHEVSGIPLFHTAGAIALAADICNIQGASSPFIGYPVPLPHEKMINEPRRGDSLAILPHSATRTTPRLLAVRPPRRLAS